MLLADYADDAGQTGLPPRELLELRNGIAVERNTKKPCVNDSLWEEDDWLSELWREKPDQWFPQRQGRGSNGWMRNKWMSLPPVAYEEFVPRLLDTKLTHLEIEEVTKVVVVLGLDELLCPECMRRGLWHLHEPHHPLLKLVDLFMSTVTLGGCKEAGLRIVWFIDNVLTLLCCSPLWNAPRAGGKTANTVGRMIRTSSSPSLPIDVAVRALSPPRGGSLSLTPRLVSSAPRPPEAPLLVGPSSSSNDDQSEKNGDLVNYYCTESPFDCFERYLMTRLFHMYVASVRRGADSDQLHTLCFWWVAACVGSLCWCFMLVFSARVSARLLIGVQNIRMHIRGGQGGPLAQLAGGVTQPDE